MRRREFIVALGSAAAWSLPVQGQQAASRSVGVLDIGSLEGARLNFGLVQHRLTEMGFVEGRNLTVEYRCADGHEDRLGGLARDLVQHRVNAIAVFAGPSVVAAKAATTSIPIIFLTGFDPVESGFVASMNRPGGNVTGVSVLNVEVMAKRLQVLCELLLTAKSVGFIYNPTGLVSGYEDTLKRLELAADALRVKLLRVQVGGSDEFGEAFARMAAVRPDALLISADALMLRNRKSLVDLAAQHRMPTLYPIREFAVDGGLVSYGPNYAEARRQVGDYLGRVLNDEKPENLPVQQVTKFELVINKKTADALGIAVPPALLGRADDVIE